MADLESLKLGRARPALVENIKVAAYEGSILTIRELASITVPDPQQIVITPWDRGVLQKIAQAIATSDLMVTPMAEEDLIRIRIPALTDDRREELIKAVEMKLEGGRKMIRDIRNGIKADMEKSKDDAGVSEDDIFRGKEDLQKLHDNWLKKIEELGNGKIAEIRL